MEQTLQVYLTNAADILQFESEPHYSVGMEKEPSEYLTTKAGYLHLGVVTAKFPDVPTRGQLIIKTVGGMRAEVQRIRAEAEMNAKMMEQQINDLLMIGHDRTEDFV